MNSKMKSLVKRFIRNVNRIERDYEYKRLAALLEHEKFEPVKQCRLRTIRNIIFIIPNMVPYSGGRTSVLRLGTALEMEGYSVFYMTYGNQNKAEMHEAAKINLPGYKGRMIECDAAFPADEDVVIATSWESVYFAKKTAGYKMYFIQDYEPYFHEAGDKQMLAMETYKYGFHMVSLGAWNAEVIGRELGISVDHVIDFPFESGEYEITKRDFSHYCEKEDYSIAVYVKKDSKRLPVLIPYMMGGLTEAFEKNGKSLHVFYFGSEKSEEYKNGINLGKLHKQELRQLYETCDFGMAASMTNISLVPYEMMASGLPVIEFEDGSAKSFFPEDTVILTGLNTGELGTRLLELMNQPEKIDRMITEGQRYINNFSWRKTCSQFSDIIGGIIRDKD